MIERVHEAKENICVVPTFYMDSYLLEFLCDAHIFVGTNFSWYISKALVHVYCHILWDNKCKRSYKNMCDS